MTKEQSYTRFWEGSKRMWITFLFFSFIMIGFVQAANTAFAQTTVTVNVQDATLSDVLWEIQRQTDFTFIYSTNDVKNVKVRNLRVTNGKIAAVLDECLKNSGLAYVVKDGAIAIRPANEVNAVKAVEQANVISGTVVDETGEPVIGANVLVKGTTNGQITDLNGGFSIKVEHASATLLVSYVGYVRQEVKATSGKILKIVLVPDANMMEEVVVTGYGTFKKSAHAQVTALADKVMDAVKSGAIRKFFVMAGCDGRMKSREYYTEFAQKLPGDTVILTAGCAKYRYNKLALGDINGIPRVLDAGQCNDSYSLAVIALKLKEIFGLDDVNQLPIVYNIAWYEQKAVIVLLALLALGVKHIHLGPTLPAFLSPNVKNVLIEQFGIGGISTVDEDIVKFLS